MVSRRLSVTIVAIAALAGPIVPWTVRSAAAGLKASEPRPEDGAVGVELPLLTWKPGETAVFHNLYFGTKADLMEADLVAVRQPFSMHYLVQGLEPGEAYYWRVDEIEVDGVTVHTGDVWTFKTLAPVASNPSPPNGAVSVDPQTKLTWLPGANAVMHDVYLGTDEGAVAAGANDTLVSSGQPQPIYDPGVLDRGVTYYWRIDERQAGSARQGGGAKYTGSVWHFTTAEEGQGVVYHVAARNGSDDNDGLSAETAFATIQTGIDAAGDGDTILVYPGVYREPVDFLGKAVTVRSAARAAVLAVGADFAVSFCMGEGPESVLENFIIRNSFMAVFIVESAPTIRNLTVVNNKYGVEAYAQAEPDISNCIFWYNTGDDLFGCKARYSCIERGSPGTGNFSSDPLFARPDARDYHLLSWRGRYWPEHDVWVLDKLTSPCVDAGDPNADYSNEPIPNGGRINMGAYGGTAYASLSEQRPVCNQVPAVAITSPRDGAMVGWSPQTIRIVVEASDVDGVVVKVEFFANGDKIGEDTDGGDGWVMEWADGLLDGCELVALATDNDGATTESVPVTIVHRPIPQRR